jgi:hypothetical protein
MKTVGDDDAFPHKSQVGFSLTKREEFAKAALQGLLAYPHNKGVGAADMADGAVLYADALIEALNAKEGET